MKGFAMKQKIVPIMLCEGKETNNCNENEKFVSIEKFEMKALLEYDLLI